MKSPTMTWERDALIEGLRQMAAVIVDQSPAAGPEVREAVQSACQLLEAAATALESPPSRPSPEGPVVPNLLTGPQHGAHSGVAPTPDLVLFARALHVIVTMVETDTRAGLYGQAGRPNFTSIREFLAMGLPNVPELAALSAVWLDASALEEGRAYFGDLAQLRAAAASVREMVEGIPPEKGVKDTFLPLSVGGTAIPLAGKSRGERAELLAILNGGDGAGNSRVAPGAGN